MARTHARLLTTVWQDDDFRALSSSAQRTYFLILSQPDLTHCGVVAYRPKRWGQLAVDASPRAVEKAVGELVERGYVMLDRQTDELWVRSFIKHDGLLKSPNMVKAMWASFAGVLSKPIREGFEELFDKLVAEGFASQRGVGEGVGANRLRERCARCKKLDVDCECPKLESVGA